MKKQKISLKFLKKYQKESILAPLFKLLEALMDLTVPLVVAQIIKNGIGQNDMSYVLKMFGLLLLLAVLGMAFSFTAQWFAAKASTGYATDLRQELFDNIQDLTYAELDQLGTDTLITRMTSDVLQVQTGLNLALRLLLRSPFIVFGAMIVAFTIDVKSALIFVVTIPVLAVVIFTIMWLSIPLYKKVQSALDKLLGTLRENLLGVRVIRAFRKEDAEVQQFNQENDTLTKYNEHVGRLSALMNPLTYILINVAIITLIYVGAIRVDGGIIAQADVVALYNLMALIIVELIKLSSLIITINKSLACLERIEVVLVVKRQMVYKMEPVKEDKSAPAVVFDQVSFSYPQAGADAISNISFVANRGETIGIIGGTGCGKSTVVQLIPRYYDVQSGKVCVNGVNVKDYPQGELVSKVGMIPQKAVLFEGTIRENMQWGKEDATDEEIWHALEIAQAADVVRSKNGLDAMIEQNGRNLSGGQKQRLTIARALLKNPEILIMDDSASALDFATDLKLRRAIHNLGNQMTVFIVSQRASTVRAANQILVLDDGNLVGKGTHDELMENCQVYQEIYYSQFPEEKPKEVMA
ncbi:MAG: ABC transporter ATP-binding protein [Solobacterium sp.]|nr:ABC transporter ATP-binding protein [Solobacterium sp.]